MLEVLFEDKNIIACVKPVGICSQGADGSMEHLLAEHFASRSDAATPYVVHRLDSGVGGVMVYAKNKASAARLSGIIAKDPFDKRCEDDGECFSKEYLAVLIGTPEQKEGYLQDLLYHDRQKNKTYVVDRERKGVKRALLFYDVLDSALVDGKVLTLVRVKLFTGRTHQIRVQFASRGLPLFADGRYGARGASGDIGLWSYRIRLSLHGKNDRVFEKAPTDVLPWIAFEFFKG